MDTAENGLKDVVGIGNAIVDILAHADDEFLARHVMAKGAMTLVDAEQAARIYEAMGPKMEQSGGSVGNTMAGIAALGGTGSYIGKVRDDPFGAVFRHDLHAMGISTEGQPAHDGQPTGRCLVVVTPDGERTMATHLGACVELEPGDIEPEDDPGPPGGVPRGVPVGPAAGEGGDGQGGGDGPRGPTPGGADAV